MMTKEKALTRIQMKIDEPMISMNEKRQLFSLYQDISQANSLSPQLEDTVRSMTKRDDDNDDDDDDE